MKAKILIVEDQFIEAKSLNVILTNAGYSTCTIARSVTAALSIIEKEKPDLVLVDIFLQGEGTGIDLGKILNEKNMAFVYLSANSNRQILEEAKSTKPYGFMVKPFRAKDVLIMLDVALYLHKNRQTEKLIFLHHKKLHRLYFLLNSVTWLAGARNFSNHLNGLKWLALQILRY